MCKYTSFRCMMCSYVLQLIICDTCNTIDINKFKQQKKCITSLDWLLMMY